MMMKRIVVAAALVLCLPLAAQAQEKKPAAQAWNDLYAKREGKEHQFNKFLAEVVKERAPGKALDIGMGQGRNSLFLAALGWDVTGFDISEVGVKQAQAEAEKRKLKINATVGDVDKFDYGKERYDLIVGMYMHEYLNRNAAKVTAALKPGGLLVVEGIHRDINKANLQGVKNYGYKSNELSALFKGLRLRHYEDLMTQSDWDRSGGKPVPVVRLLAQKDQAQAKKK
jgi:cyclopropane fatty-acyl-phospholipid synthase-like methyltransferase